MDSTRQQRNTRQRQVVFDELRRLTSHPTAAELYAIVRQRLPKISLGTVYRNLEMLAQMGLVRKLEFGGGQTRFDGNLMRHEHVRCVRCGRVDDVSVRPLDFSYPAANDCCGYRMLGHRLEFLGVCPQCTGQQHGGGEDWRQRHNDGFSGGRRRTTNNQQTQIKVFHEP